MRCWAEHVVNVNRRFSFSASHSVAARARSLCPVPFDRIFWPAVEKIDQASKEGFCTPGSTVFLYCAW